MIIETHDERLLEHARRSHDRAIDATLDDARARAPRVSGRYATSLEATTVDTPDGPVTRIGSRLPQAPAIEQGADVGDRRGPHMQAVGHLREAGRDYARNMDEALRREPIR